MGDGDPEVRQGRTIVRWLVLAGLVAGTTLIAWRTSSVSTTLELVAVLGVLLGLAVAFGGLEPRRKRGLRPPGRVDADPRTASVAAATLDSLDRIEHRNVELGTPWPRLIVGPTGVAVVDVCTLTGPVEIDARGVHGRRSRHCPRCRTSAAIAASLRDALGLEQVTAPVRFIAVVPEGTTVTIALDAPGGVTAVSVDALADVLSRGPVLPMETVDHVFARLTHTAATRGGLVRG